MASVVFSLILVVQKSTQTRIKIIGRLPNTDEWVPVDEDEEAREEIPGVVSNSYLLLVEVDLTSIIACRKDPRIAQFCQYWPIERTPAAGMSSLSSYLEVMGVALIGLTSSSWSYTVCRNPTHRMNPGENLPKRSSCTWAMYVSSSSLPPIGLTNQQVEDIDASAVQILYDLTKAYSERGVGLHFAHLRESQMERFKLVGISDLVSLLDSV